MESFFVALNAVLPMFIMLFIGFLVRKLKILQDSFLPQLNKIVFNVFFPFLMFNNIYGSDFSSVFSPKLLAFAVIGVFTIYFLSIGFTLLVEKSNYSRGAMIQAIYRSNFVLMGLPIAANIFGKDKLGMTAVLVAVVVPIYNMLAVITLEIFRGQKINVLKILKGIAKNPLIIGSVLGLLSVAFNISLPDTIDTTVSDIAAVATPLALIVLGASVTFESIKGCSRNLIICIIARLVVVPALCLGTAALIGIRGVDFVSLIGLFASPCAVSSCRSCTAPYFDDEFTKDEQRIARDEDGNNYYVPADMTYSEWKKSFVDGQTDDLKETKTDDTISLKNKISEQDNRIDELKNQFSDATDGYSYDEWFSEFSSIEEGYGDASDGDATFTKLKNLDEEIRNAEKQRSDLLLQKESRGQLDTGFPGKVPNDKLDEYNAKAFEQIKVDTGYSEEQATEFHSALKEYFGGDYASILAGEGSTVKTIRDGLDRMPVYDGTVYRGLCFSESSDYDISEFTRLKPGDKIPSKGIISSWSSDKRVAEAFGAASTQAVESSTVILECLENKTDVGVQHISSYGSREAEVLCGSKYEVLEIVTESKYDYVSRRKDLLYFSDDLTEWEDELKKQVVCVIKVKEV